jgi:asparagine synthetase B (glutamine-hydrolysing)
MCGILALINSQTTSIQENLVHNIRNRGPDSLSTISLNKGKLQLLGSVLSLRGQTVIPQPKQFFNSGCILLFNGEIFGGIDSVEESDILGLSKMLDTPDLTLGNSHILIS